MNRSVLRTGTLHWTDVEGQRARGLILLHSLGTGLGMWDAQLKPLTARRRVVAIDLPGHGQSTARPGEYRLEDLGDDVLDIATEAGLEHFDVCGTSLGGLIGLWLAVHASARVALLVVSNTAARIGSAQLWSERMSAVAHSGLEGIVNEVVPRFFGPNLARERPETLEKVVAMFLSVDPEGYVGCCAALRDADLRGSIPAISCPTLIIAGDADLATPPRQAEWLHRHIQGSRLAIIPGAGHLANLDQPATFTRLLMSALEA